MKKLNGRTVNIIAIAVAVLVTLGAIAGVFIYKQSKIDPLARELGVKDAVVKDDRAISPYGVSLEGLEKAIKEDSFLNENYNLKTSMSESLANRNNRELYSLDRQFILTGVHKIAEKQATNDFNAYMETHGTFENPSSLRLVYTYDASSDIVAIQKSNEGIISKLFNAELAKFVFSKAEDNYVTTVKSKSTDYTLTISKGLESHEASESTGALKQMSISIDFNETKLTNYNLSTFEHNKGIRTSYNTLGIFKETKVSELAKKYSELHGTYTEARLDLLENSLKNLSSYKKAFSTIQVTTIYEDGSTTTAVINLIDTLGNDGKLTEAKISYESALRYRKTTEEVMQDATKILKGLANIDVVTTADEIKAGKFTRAIKGKLGDAEYNIEFKVSTDSDANGIYGRIQLVGN